jgi:hypothetical protein
MESFVDKMVYIIIFVQTKVVQKIKKIKQQEHKITIK